MNKTSCNIPNSKEYEDNLKVVSNLLSVEMQKVDANPKHSVTGTNYNLLSDRGQYLVHINELHCRLTQLLDDLDMIDIFITNYPNLDIYKQNNINESRVLKYHLEVFYHKIHTISEVMRIYVSNIYELGIPDEKLKFHNLKSNENKINRNVFNIIQRYFDSFNNLINVRHANSHRDLNVNPDSFLIDAWLFISNDNNFESDIPHEWIKKEIKINKMNNLNLVQRSKTFAKIYVNELFRETIFEIRIRAENK